MKEFLTLSYNTIQEYIIYFNMYKIKIYINTH